VNIAVHGVESMGPFYALRVHSPPSQTADTSRRNDPIRGTKKPAGNFPAGFSVCHESGVALDPYFKRTHRTPDLSAVRKTVEKKPDGLISIRLGVLKKRRCHRTDWLTFR
jgi:hypothetical protein